MSQDFSVPNNRYAFHLEMMTPAGPRRRCNPHFGLLDGDLLLKLTDPALRGPAAHWEGVCTNCRATLGLDDLLLARRGHAEAPHCRHGVSYQERCDACDVALRRYSADLSHEDTPIEGWAVLPFGAMTIGPGHTMEVVARPQRIMAGPYRLRLHVEPPGTSSKAAIELKDQIYLQDIKVGQCTLVYSYGQIWGWSFEELESNKPVADRLLPLAGPLLNLGNQIVVTLHNAANINARVSLVLFGQGMNEERQRAHGVPRARAGDCRTRQAGPGRPPQYPAHLSVPLPEWSKHALGIGDDLDAAFAIDGHDYTAAASAAARASYTRLPPSGPLLDERQVVELDPGEAACILKAAAVVRALKSWRPGELFAGGSPVLPRFEVAGVEYEVRRYEPPAPPAPPEPSADEQRWINACWQDRAATTSHLLRGLEADENETAWQSATDEDP